MSHLPKMAFESCPAQGPSTPARPPSPKQRSAGLEETCGFLPPPRFCPPLPTRLTVHGQRTPATRTPAKRTITQLQKIFPLNPQQLRKSKPPKPLHPHRILVSRNPNGNRQTTPRQPQERKKIHRAKHPRGKSSLIQKRPQTRPARKSPPRNPPIRTPCSPAKTPPTSTANSPRSRTGLSREIL